MADLLSSRNLLLFAVFVALLLVFRLTTSDSHSSTPASVRPVVNNHHESEDEDSTTAAAAALSIPRKKPTTAPSLLNGVILYLSGGRWESYFVRHALPRLDEYFVSCFPYPVIVFHEAAPADQQLAIRQALSKGNAAFKKRHNNNNDEIVTFDDVADFWKHLPPQVSEAQLQTWLRDPTQRKFQGRGYRLMCRFWAGSVWLRRSLDAFEYYWRLDTDSILTRPLTVDPFRLVFRQRKCVYGFNRLKGENPHVAVDMFDTFKKFLVESPAVQEELTQEDKRRCIDWVTHRSDGVADGGRGAFWAPMYYNNFEMGTMALKRSRLYQEFFRWVDERPPFGIFRYRWGDAPLHTLGILVAQKCSVRRFCNVSFSEVPYRHGVTRIPAMMPKEGCPGGEV